MAERLVLHIGSMKSGTSFIQHVLDQRREPLRELGFDFSGTRWRRQVSAVLELIECGGRGQPPLPDGGAWNTLVDDINAWPGTALVSMEFLGPRSRAKIELIQRSVPDTDVQVILTARDLTRQLPAMWQEAVQNRSAVTWPEYVEAVRRRPRRSGPGSSFWKQQAVDEIAGRWSEVVGRDHFTLITVPPPGAPPGLLWERFAKVTGLPPDLADNVGTRGNPSIGTASAMVMRSLNERLASEGLSRNDYMRVVKAGLAKRGLVRRVEPKLGLDEGWLHKRAHRQIAHLRELDLRIEGDLEDLAPRTVPGVHTADVGPEQQLDAAVEGLAFLVHRQVELDAEVKRLQRQLRGARRGAGEPDEGDVDGGAEGLEASVGADVDV